MLCLEELETRLVPTAAFFSNGLLFVQGDNAGNQISVGADANGNLTVSERGQSVAIQGAAPATTANTGLVVEQAGTGENNTLATDKSLGKVANSLLGNGSGIVNLLPGNKAPSFAVGSPNVLAANHLASNPGGQDVFVGGAGRNLFDWQPGTGTNVYVGAGRHNTVLVVGNKGGQAESDSLTSDGQGGVVYARNNLVPFKLFTTGIQQWDIQPSTGPNNVVTIGDLSRTPTRLVEVDQSNGTVDASAQANRSVDLIVNGTGNTVLPGAGSTRLINRPAPTAPSLSALDLLFANSRDLLFASSVP